MKDFLIDEDEVPRGSCSTRWYEDEKCEIFTGGGNTLDDRRPIIKVTLKQLGGVTVVGGRSLRDKIASTEPSGRAEAALAYIVEKDPGRSMALLYNVFIDTYYTGVKDGKNAKVNQLLKVLERE